MLILKSFCGENRFREQGKKKGMNFLINILLFLLFFHLNQSQSIQNVNHIDCHGFPSPWHEWLIRHHFQAASQWAKKAFSHLTSRGARDFDYARWFDSKKDPNRFEIVSKNLETMNIKLHTTPFNFVYSTEGLCDGYAVAYANLKFADNNVIIICPVLFQFVLQAKLDPISLHIFSVTATIFHEMTHTFINTNDSKSYTSEVPPPNDFFYSSSYSQWLAENDQDNAIKHASSYVYYYLYGCPHTLSIRSYEGKSCGVNPSSLMVCDGHYDTSFEFNLNEHDPQITPRTYRYMGLSFGPAGSLRVSPLLSKFEINYVGNGASSITTKDGRDGHAHSIYSLALYDEKEIVKTLSDHQFQLLWEV